jgi:hypothetical protein
MEKKLKVKYSTFQTPLSFNEWAEQYRVSSLHTPETPYYTGNLTTQEWNRKSSLYNSIEELFPKVSFTKHIINKFKRKQKKDA